MINLFKIYKDLLAHQRGREANRQTQFSVNQITFKTTVDLESTICIPFLIIYRALN